MRSIYLFGVMLLLMTFGSALIAGDQKSQNPSQKQTQMQNKETVYGWELMSVKERNEHRQKMRSLKTEEERTAYIEEHHKMMQERAKKKGVTLPDRPMRGGGLGGGQRRQEKQ